MRGGAGASTATEEPRAATSDAAAERPSWYYSELVQPQQVAASLSGEEIGYRELSPADRRRVRFGARALLWEASSLKAVRCCGRLIDKKAADDGVDWVSVRLSGGQQPVAGYGNLAACGSVWACPRCSAVIAAERAAAMGEAIRKCLAEGGSVHLLTLTMRHADTDALSTLWDGLSRGWRALFGVVAWTGKKESVERGKVRPARIGQAEVFDVAGLSRTVEITGGGPSGWHVHIHCLVFRASASWGTAVAPYASELLVSWGVNERAIGGSQFWDWIGGTAFAAACMTRWRKGLESKGFECGSAGVDLRRVSDFGAEFLGSYLTKATYDAAHEVASGQAMKEGRGGGQPPFRLLYDLAMDESARRWFLRTPRRWDIFRDDDDPSVWLLVDLDTAEVRPVKPPRAWLLWWEFETASRGRRQLIWSRRVKAPTTARQELWNSILDARGVERDDEEIASDELGGDILGTIAASTWYARMVRRPTWLAEVLEAAETGGSAAVDAWFGAHEIEWTPR